MLEAALVGEVVDPLEEIGGPLTELLIPVDDMPGLEERLDALRLEEAVIADDAPDVADSDGPTEALTETLEELGLADAVFDI